MNDTYIAHWGIKGQKWGVRRFQNEDGTLTEAGRSRYGTGERPPRDIRKKLRAANRVDAAERELQRGAERATNERDREIFSRGADAARKNREMVLDEIRKSGSYEVTSKEVNRVSQRTKSIAAAIIGGVASVAISQIVSNTVPIARFVINKPRTTWGTAADY